MDFLVSIGLTSFSSVMWLVIGVLSSLPTMYSLDKRNRNLAKDREALVKALSAVDSVALQDYFRSIEEEAK